MDRKNLADLKEICPKNYLPRIELLLNYVPHSETQDVPDPYYDGGDGFDRVLDLIERASDGLITALKAEAAL